MGVREDLYKALRDGVMGVNGRVYPLTMPQDTHKPSLVYTFLGNYDNTGICGESTMQDFLVQIDVFATTYKESSDIRGVVESVLRDNFNISQMSGYEMYENITLKYRQVLSFQMKTILPSIIITGITEDVDGTCAYNGGQTCVAQSTYSAVVVNGGTYVDYVWTLTGATIVSGQGTSTIVLSTDSDEATVNFNVACEVTSDRGIDDMSADFDPSSESSCNYLSLYKLMMKLLLLQV